jgi:hypothetical protein
LASQCIRALAFAQFEATLSRLEEAAVLTPAAAGGGEQQKVTPFCELARESWQDARSLADKV